MSEETLIKVEGVSKRFCRSLKKSLWYGVQDLGNEILGRRHGGNGELRLDEFWAVKDVSFELKRGECLGLIGRNGSGKTTLLRMINGLIKPDGGSIQLRGRVGALIALGAGFNPILTGRENIYVNASVLGLTKHQINDKIDEIIDFAEIGDFIDMPLQSYSSGMNVRLGFAVASSLEPDILLLDEVLAVGDVGFRIKCYNRIDSIAHKSAIIFVTHSMPQIARMCNKTLFIEKGSSQGVLPIAEGISCYDNACSAGTNTVLRSGSHEAAFVNLSVNEQILDLSSPNRIDVDFGSELAFEVDFIADLDCELVIDITFHSIAGEAIAECNNFVQPHTLKVRAGELQKLKITIGYISLNPGAYNMGILLMSGNMLRHYDWIKDLVDLRVRGRPATAGQQFFAHWDSVGVGDMP